jgi:hypothetical protein
VQRLGEYARRDQVLPDVVEAAAVDLPRFAADARVDIPLGLGRPQVVVERDEVEGRADPDDAGNDVQPAEEEVQPISCVGVEG